MKEKTTRKIKKQVKRNNLNSFSSYDYSVIDSSSGNNKPYYRRKWNF